MTTHQLTFNDIMDIQHALGVRVLEFKKFRDSECSLLSPYLSSEKLIAYYQSEIDRAEALIAKLNF